jgi:hypothetical protein
LARQLAIQVVNCKLHWWPLRSYLAGLTLAQMWERYYTEKFGIVRQHYIKKTCLEKQIESIMIITAGWHEIKHALVSVNSYINVLSELMIEFVDSIGDLNWWFSNVLGIWELIIQKIGGKVREVLFETKREIKIDIFVLQFTEFVRFFNITIGEIRTEYKLWLMEKSVDLQDTFLNISDNIEFTLPCAERHLELLIMTYADFDRKYLICPGETLAIYGLLRDVDDYIDLKLGRFPLNEYQQNQMVIAKNKFIEGHMKINENSFKSRELLKQHNDKTEEPINLDLGPLKIENALLKNEKNKTHISIVMPYSNEVLDESGNIFRIKVPYILDCNKSKQFPYIKS